MVTAGDDLVHPEERAELLPATGEWTLAQRYIELTLLKPSGFTGEHTNWTTSPVVTRGEAFTTQHGQAMARNG
jgi:hypothetical protein